MRAGRLWLLVAHAPTAACRVLGVLTHVSAATTTVALPPIEGGQEFCLAGCLGRYQRGQPRSPPFRRMSYTAKPDRCPPRAQSHRRFFCPAPFACPACHLDLLSANAGWQVYLEPEDGWRPDWEKGVMAAVVLGCLLMSLLVGIIMASWAEQIRLLGDVMVRPTQGMKAGWGLVSSFLFISSFSRSLFAHLLLWRQRRQKAVAAKLAASACVLRPEAAHRSDSFFGFFSRRLLLLTLRLGHTNKFYPAPATVCPCRTATSSWSRRRASCRRRSCGWMHCWCGSTT